MKAKATHITWFTCVLLLSVFLSEAVAQSYYFKQYNVNDGLPFVQAYAIHQDTEGYLWTGGYGGLSRFDGESFQNYGKQEGLVNTFVTAIESDWNGKLWVGTTRGLNIIDDDEIMTLRESNGLAGIRILSLIRYDTLMLVGCEGGLSVFYKSGKVRDIPLRIGDKKISILSLEIDPRGWVWLGTNRGLFQYKDGNVLRKMLPDVPRKLRVESLWIDTDTTLYVGSNRGLLVNRQNETRQLNFLDGLIGSYVQSILRIDETRIWVATDVALHEFDGVRLKTVSVGTHPSSNNIEFLYKDYENNIWLGSYYGLFKSTGRTFQNYSFKDGFPANFIFQITEDPKGDLWVASRGNGVLRYDGDFFKTYNTSHGLPGNIVRPILATDQAIYVGTNRGLSIRKNGRFTNYDKADGMPFNQVYSLFQDSLGLLYLGGTAGFATFDGDAFTFHQISNQDGTQVWAFHENTNGIWIGSYESGLFLKQEDSIVSMSDRWGLENENFIGILEDKRKNMWFATFEGVLFYDQQNDSLIRVTTQEGLNSNLIYCLTFDQNQENLWVGTNQGINKIDLRSFYDKQEFNIQSFGIDDGFVGVECNAHGAFCDSEGTIWFGTVNGLVSMNPKEFNLNTSENRLHITGFKLFYKDTVLAPQAKLPPDKNHLTIRYKGICLSNAAKVYYRFKLEGYDKSWSPITQMKEATYANLPPGKYTFKVISRNNSGIWNTEPQEFQFSVAYPIWMKWWFLGGSGTFTIAFVYMGIAYQIRRIKQRTALERRLENLKLQALRSQMNPHFIFNSMNSIQHFINNNEKREANFYLSKFATLMRSILENSRKPAVPVSDDMEALRLYMELEQMRFEDRFDFSIEMQEQVEMEDPEIPPMLIQPFVENSIVHGFIRLQHRGLIQILLEQDQQQLVCTITDNGIGREEAQKIKQKKEAKLHRSAGMSIIQERLDTLSEFYNEKLFVNIQDLFNENGKACGTRITLKIPIMNA